MSENWVEEVSGFWQNVTDLVRKIEQRQKLMID
jgi:hypothetical protein